MNHLHLVACSRGQDAYSLRYPYSVLRSALRYDGDRAARFNLSGVLVERGFICPQNHLLAQEFPAFSYTKTHRALDFNRTLEVNHRRILADPLDFECSQGCGPLAVGCNSHHVFWLLSTGYATEENQQSAPHRCTSLTAGLTGPKAIRFQICSEHCLRPA